jgi:membrane protein implicated in regulation of membrane protease activity
VKALRKLILGETWTLPIGVALTLAVGLVLSGASWWPDAGGFVLLALVLATLFAALTGSRARR